MQGRILVGTNLLVLFVVGTASPRLIDSHERTKIYTLADLDLPAALVSATSAIVTTPNILTETSTPIRQVREPGRSRIGDAFRRFVAAAAECYVPGATAVARAEFGRLGLTDAAIVVAQDAGVTLLTDDLYLACATAGRTVIRFTHERERWLT